MSLFTDSTRNHLLLSSVLGIGRGLTVHVLIFPLETVKTLYQTQSTHEKMHQIARSIFKKEGLAAFYRGIAPKLVSTAVKQAWCWPLMTGIPIFLEDHKTNPYVQQGLTGFGIATLDAAVTTPLERMKVLSIVRRSEVFLFRNVYENGWHGFGTHWAKLSVSWMSFLVAQKVLRDAECARSGKQDLSSVQLMKVSLEVASVVSVISAPFDMANTLKQSRELGLTYLFSGNVLQKMFRGWSLSASSLIIHNIASITLIDYLERLRSD